MAFSMPRSAKVDFHGPSHQVATYMKALIDCFSDEELLGARESAILAVFVLGLDLAPHRPLDGLFGAKKCQGLFPRT